MPQTLLPVYPSDATPINDIISFCKRDGSIYYWSRFKYSRRISNN